MSSSVNIGVYNSALFTSAAYAASLASAKSILGVTPNVVNNGIGFGATQPMSMWVSEATSEAQLTAKAPGGTSNIPDLSLPMMDSSGSMTMIQAMDQIASGADNSVWTGIVNAYKAAGFKTIYIRPGWEMNGNWFPWSVYTEAQAQAYIAAFDEISQACHSVSGINVEMVWNPDQIDNSALPTQDMYPGDDYVDVIGQDFYDDLYPYSLYDWSTGKTDATIQQWWSNPVNLEHYWSYPNSTPYAPEGQPNEWSLLDSLAFAAAHNKPLALPEVGNSGNGTTTGPLTDPDFPAYLARVLLAPGAPSLAFISIWDKIGSSSNFTDSSNPVMAAAWADFVKKIEQNDPGPDVTMPSSITVSHNKVTNILSLLNKLITPGRSGDTETITSVSVVSGSVTLSNGNVLYKAGAAGSDTITYTVTDQLGDTFNATTTILIDGGPTINTAPTKVAHGQSIALATLGADLVTVGATGDTETFSQVKSANGTLTAGSGGQLTYTPPASGTDTLSYTVTDQVGDSVSGSSTILVDPGPILKTGGAGATPGQVMSLNYYLTQLITPGLAGDTETITSVTASAGTVVLGSNSITYTAPSGGRGILTFTVRDQLGDTATSTYAVTVNPSTVDGTVTLFGVPGGSAFGTGDSGVLVTLLTAAGTVVATATTASNGWYSIGLLLPGSYKLTYAPPPNQVVMAGSSTTTAAFSVGTGVTVNEPSVHFDQMASLAGQVALSGGSGLAGVTVELVSTTGTVLQTLTTDSNGNFSFYGLAAGSYQVQYFAPTGDVFQSGGSVNANGLSAVVSLTAAQAGSLPTVVLLSDLCTINGSVTYDGAGEAGVTITLLDDSGNILSTTTSGTDGSFSFGGLASGSYQVSYTAPSGQVLGVGGPADPTTGLTSLITVTSGETASLQAEELLTQFASLTGQVLLGTSGLAGVTVELLTTSGAVVQTLTTDTNGDFTFSGVAAGKYQVLYLAPAGDLFQTGGPVSSGGLSAVISLAAAQTASLPTAVLLTGLSTIAGSVTYNGAGEAGVTVSLLDADGNLLSTVTSAAMGTFSFGNLVYGSYEVSYTAPTGQVLGSSGPANSSTGLTPLITVTPGQTTSLAPENLLNEYGNISSTIAHLGGASDPAWGTGVGGVTVTLFDGSGDVLATTVTDAVGWYVFSRLVAGTYELGVTVPAGDEIEPGTTTVSAPIVLTTGNSIIAPKFYLIDDPDDASLSGQVLLYGGSGLAGVTVELLSTTGTVVQVLTTDGNGNFTFSGLEAGSYQVQYTAPPGDLFQPGGPVSASGLSAVVTLAPTQAGSVAAAVVLPGLSTIEGSVIYNGAGEAGVAVSLLDSNGNVVSTTTSAADGSFSFGNLAYGSYQVSYTAPPGLVLQTSSSANSSTGLTPLFTVAPGQTTTLAPEAVLSQPANINSTVAHLGGATDPVWGTGVSGVTVSLLDMSGNVLATTVTSSQGWYIFRQLGAGTYQISMTAPAGAEVEPGTSGVISSITVATGASVIAPKLYLVSAFSLDGSGVSNTQGDGSYIVTGDASNSTLTLGNGNQQVTLTGTADTVVTGNGNQTIALSGTNNSVTIGTGTSTINAGSGNAVVHAAGGNVTITAGGADNLFDAGTGLGFLYADGSAGNVFMLNPGGVSGLTQITGFNVAAGDVLDLSRTLAGTGILPDLSNVGSYVTATYSGGNTALSEIPSGGGTAQPFAVLMGVQTTVAALQAANDFSLT